MTFAPADLRAEADRCPGVLRPHRAADGALLRLRLPGGRLRAESLRILGAASRRYANGEVQLTSRGNVQLRGVVTDDHGAVSVELVDEVVRAGLLPRPSHERVRNIVCSPLTGLLGGLADLRPLLLELDERLCRSATLAELPGPFLFSLDDGRGDVGAMNADLGVQALDARSVRVAIGDLPAGPVVPLSRAAELMINLAEQFLEAAGRRIWHVRELPHGGRELLAGTDLEPTEFARVPGTGVSLGRMTQRDGRELVSALVPLGLLTGEQLTALVEVAALGSGELIVTPWRGVLVPDLPAAAAQPVTRILTSSGLVVADGSAWRGITACTGAPRCAHGLGETRSLATSIAAERGPGAVDRLLPVHVIGCARGCGSPPGEHVELLTDGRRAEIRRGAAVVEVPLAAAARTVQESRPVLTGGNR